MQNLVDTHTLIWFLNGDDSLSLKARKSIEKEGVINFVSIASIWEIAIKISLKKLELKTTLQQFEELLYKNDFNILPISIADTILISELPFYHRDPFDRIIIAQGISNKLRVITKDVVFSNYNVKTLW